MGSRNSYCLCQNFSTRSIDLVSEGYIHSICMRGKIHCSHSVVAVLYLLSLIAACGSFLSIYKQYDGLRENIWIFRGLTKNSLTRDSLNKGKRKVFLSVSAPSQFPKSRHKQYCDSHFLDQLFSLSHV